MGIYSVRFLSNKDLVGVGIAVIDGTTLHGGGFDYLYKGTYRVADYNMVIATVDLENYSGKPNAVLGLFRFYQLTLSGLATPQVFTLSGQVRGQPQLIVSLELTKIGELVDQ
ncbi:MAG: GrlR family regulatory protein [Nitrospirota bacterium]